MSVLDKLKKNRRDYIFLTTALIIPIVQLLICYVWVNFNSISLAFKDTADGIHFEFVWFDNFKKVIDDILHSWDMQTMLGNTFKMYFFSQIVTVFIALILAYMIWKKCFAHRFFSVLLFLPQVVSSVIFVMLSRYIIAYALPVIFNSNTIMECLNPYTSGFDVVLGIGCFLSIGGTLVLILGGMSNVDQSVMEYAKIDGCNAVQEFIHVVFPAVYPTLISLFVIGLAGIFSNQGLLFPFYGLTTEASVKTIGLHIYLTVYVNNDFIQYPYLSALGLLASIITIFLSFGGRKLLEKIGPSED